MKLVVKIEYAPCESLGDLLRIGVDKVKISSDIAWKQLCIKVPASLSISTKDDEKNTTYTAALKFKTQDPKGYTIRSAWRVTLEDGTQYLIGSGSRPYPTATLSFSMPETATDSQLIEITVNFISDKAIPQIVY